ncbi:hypothetical protein SPFM12_00085 [Salmonella phage SPFM12]|nr:hypothetical protein SPFM12_00085 [Salmonella phage SPFM12]
MIVFRTRANQFVNVFGGDLCGCFNFPIDFTDRTLNVVRIGLNVLETVVLCEPFAVLNVDRCFDSPVEFDTFVFVITKRRV